MTRSAVLSVAFWMLVSAIFFAAMMGVVRHLSDTMDVFVISFWRNFFAVLLFIPWFLHAGTARLATKRLGRYAARAGFLVTSSIALFTSVSYVPLSEMTALSFTAPLFTTIAAIYFLKERAGPARWIALLVGFGGVLIIMRPGAAMFEWGAILVLISSVTFAGVVVVGKQLAATESPELMTAYLSLLSVPLSLLPALFFWTWPAPADWLWLLALGAFGTANMYGIARALKVGEASLTQPFDFLRLPTMTLVAWLAFGEGLDLWTWVGAAVILASTTYVTRREVVASSGR